MLSVVEGSAEIVVGECLVGLVKYATGRSDQLESCGQRLVEGDLFLEQLHFASSIMCLLFQGLASFGLGDDVPCCCL